MYSTAYMLVVKINCHQQKCPSVKAEQQMFCCNYTCQSLCKACTKIGDIKKNLYIMKFSFFFLLFLPYPSLKTKALDGIWLLFFFSFIFFVCLAVVVIFTVLSYNVCNSNFLFHDGAWTNIHACLHVCARMIMT